LTCFGRLWLRNYLKNNV